MIHLEIRPSLHAPPSANLLRKAARLTLQRQSSAESDLTIVLTDDEEIRALQRDFLGLDTATDVLAFPAGESDPQTGRRYLGDIVISWTRAGQQAAERGHSPEAEVQLLVIHGTLHLLGFDHDGPEAQARMWEAQNAVLDHLGIGHLKTAP